MSDIEFQAMMAHANHLNYLYGLGVGLGLGKQEAEWQRLRKDLVAESLQQIDMGYEIGKRNSLHN